jgi:uncharacterized protein YecE (DUF72 family)
VRAVLKAIMAIFVGCAGWNLRRELAEFFPTVGTHLARYARTFNCVEINSSFYRPHRQATYSRWANSTAEGFRFAVKLPKQITHELRLVDVEGLIDEFIEQISGLGDRLGPILVQLPPSLAFDLDVAGQFFSLLRARTGGLMVCEPRHPTWFTSAAESVLNQFQIGRVAADPSLVPEAAEPGEFRSLVYLRWHGSPRMYYSSYDDGALADLAKRVLTCQEQGSATWCIFDNTAEGAATRNALRLGEYLVAGH